MDNETRITRLGFIPGAQVEWSTFSEAGHQRDYKGTVAQIGADGVIVECEVTGTLHRFALRRDIDRGYGLYQPSYSRMGTDPCGVELCLAWEDDDEDPNAWEDDDEDPNAWERRRLARMENKGWW